MKVMVFISTVMHMHIAAAVGCAIIVLTIALTAWKYPELPARLTYPKNYGDGGEQDMPKIVAWLVPALQICMACIIAWTASLRLADAPRTHGDPLAGLATADVVLLVLFLVQRNIMLRPSYA
jgi:hypothetical protein